MHIKKIDERLSIRIRDALYRHLCRSDGPDHFFLKVPPAKKVKATQEKFKELKAKEGK
jgi:hypothetical protein